MELRQSSAPVEYGAVDDSSRVEGVYDPQNGGETMMCTEGKQRLGVRVVCCPRGIIEDSVTTPAT